MIHKKNKIAFFLKDMAGGGAERVALLLIEEFLKKGYAIDLLLVHKSGDYLGNIPHDVTIIEAKSFSKHNTRTLDTLLWIRSYIKKEKPLVVYSLMTYANIVLCAARMLLRTETKIIISEHSVFSELIKNIKSPMVAFVIPQVVKRLYRCADNIVCVSAGAETDFVDRFPKLATKTTTIHNPVDIKYLERKSAERADGVSQSILQKEYIIMMGRLHPVKNYPLALRAFKKVLAKIPTLELVILGQGPEEASLKALCTELAIDQSVHFLGFQDNPFTYLQSAQALVLSSDCEGFGNVLVEAMALGVPVVSTDCPSGPREILKDGEYGMLAPVGDEDALAEVIQKTLSSPVDVAVLKKRASDFAVEKIAEQYLFLL